MLIAIGSVKSSPGATTAALALACAWPTQADQPRRLVLDCDAAGGEIGLRFGLAEHPGLVSLAAAARRRRDPQVIWAHTQSLTGGPPVVVGPSGAEQARAALRILTTGDTPLLRALAASPDLVAVADCGRLDIDSPAVEVFAAADAALLVTRPLWPDLAHAAARVQGLRPLLCAPGRRPVFGLVTSGNGYYGGEEITACLGVPVLGTLPADRYGAAALSGQLAYRGGLTGRDASRTPLLRAAGELATAITAALPARANDPAPLRISVPRRHAAS